jgi:uncharacterized phage-like protein YoqJ
MKVVAFTGHRPPKGGLTYSHDSEGDHLAVQAVRAWLRSHDDFEHAIVGGALGFDTLAARACWFEKVPFVVAAPFEGQAFKWPQQARDRYHRMLEMADRIVFVSEGDYSAEKMQIRNEWMINRCDHLVAWWDGSPGGTANCIKYALRSDFGAKTDHVDYTNLLLQSKDIALDPPF